MTKEKCFRSRCGLWLWIVAIAFLSVGARNFEEGLSIDGPLYAALARNLARGSDWFWMQVGLPEYPIYADHTHFGFWFHALWLKVFPATDWSLRIPSHLMYVAFLGGFWKVLRAFHSGRAATIGVLLLWIWAPFSNYFSNFYLDPGALLLGSLFLFGLYRSFRASYFWAPWAGLCLGLCFGYKGLTALAFGPTAALLSVEALVRAGQRKQILPALLKIMTALAVAALVVGAYYYAVTHSSVPDFFERYWAKQMTHRFAGSWGFFELFRWNFWLRFFKDTGWIGLLLFPALWVKKSNRLSFLIPLVMFVTVVIMYAPTDRSGGQYWILLFPWAAWLIAQFVDSLMTRVEKLNRVTSVGLMKTSAAIAVAAVLLIQYLPMRTHYRQAPPEVAIIRELPNFAEIQGIYFDLNNTNPDFASASPLLWYLDRRVDYVLTEASVPVAQPERVYVLRNPSAEKKQLLKNSAWCEVWASVYRKCP